MSLSREYTQEELAELENKSTQFHEALSEKDLSDESIENLIDILCITTNEERQLIRSYFKKSYNHPIQNDIKEKITGDLSLLQEIMINLFDTPYEYDARELKKTLSNALGGEDDTIIEIFSSRPKDYLNTVDLAYSKFYDTSLKEDLKIQLPKQFAEFLLLLMESDRPDEQTLSGDEAYEIAQEIIKNGTKVYASDADLFKKVFVEKSRIDLILVSRAYYELSEKCLFEAFEEENIVGKSIFNDEEEEKKVTNKNIKLIKALIFSVITPAEFFAKKIIASLREYNTDFNTLIRVLITRREIDMDAINEYYTKETNSDLKNDVENESTCMNYPYIGKIMLNLLNVE
jgi:hypothetical protein